LTILQRTKLYCGSNMNKTKGIALAILLMVFSINLAAAEKNPLAVWKEAGITWEHLTTNYLNDELCTKALGNSILCLFAINRMLLNVKNSMSVIPNAKIVDSQFIKLVQENVVEKPAYRLVALNKEQWQRPQGSARELLRVRSEKEVLYFWNSYFEKIDYDDWKKNISFSALLKDLRLRINQGGEDDWNEIQAAVNGINGFLNLVYDDQTHLNPAKLHQEYLYTPTKELLGIGALIRPAAEGLQILHVSQGGPAEKKDLRAYDLITHINGQKVAGTNEEWAWGILTSKANKALSLAVLRGTERMEKEISPAAMTVKFFQHHLVKFQGKTIAFWQLTRFSENVSMQMRELITQWKKEKTAVDAILLDVRQNAGGLMEEANKIASFFLPQRTLVAESKAVRDEFKSYNEQFFTEEGPEVPKLPLVLLVDAGSASGSEYLAGALADYNRAFLVGEKTYGKGTMQDVLDYQLLPGLKIYVTVAVFELPKGRSNHYVGITPHLEVLAKNSAGEKSLRLADRAVNPTRLEKEAPFNYKLPGDLQECVQAKGVADKNYRQQDVFLSFDYQYLKALDVLGCQMKIL
jgi:carboxyl-terminal processing protease